jgi:cation transport ATPase
MAGRARPRRSPPGAAAPTSSAGSAGSAAGSAEAGRRRHRDGRLWIYAGLDLAFAALYAIAIWKVIPNRLPSATVHLWTFPLASAAMAAGMLLGRRRGWWIAVIAGSFALASMVVLLVRIAISAAFLAGVYGAFGQAAATFALVMIALVIELVALLPIVQVKYLMTRAGRRAFGVPPRGGA